MEFANSTTPTPTFHTGHYHCNNKTVPIDPGNGTEVRSMTLERWQRHWDDVGKNHKKQTPRADQDKYHWGSSAQVPQKDLWEDTFKRVAPGLDFATFDVSEL
jgi:hypothetical protein